MTSSGRVATYRKLFGAFRRRRIIVMLATLVPLFAFGLLFGDFTALQTKWIFLLVALVAVTSLVAFTQAFNAYLKPVGAYVAAIDAGHADPAQFPAVKRRLDGFQRFIGYGMSGIYLCGTILVGTIGNALSGEPLMKDANIMLPVAVLGAMMSAIPLSFAAEDTASTIIAMIAGAVGVDMPPDARYNGGIARRIVLVLVGLFVMLLTVMATSTVHVVEQVQMHDMSRDAALRLTLQSIGFAAAVGALFVAVTARFLTVSVASPLTRMATLLAGAQSGDVHASDPAAREPRETAA